MKRPNRSHTHEVSGLKILLIILRMKTVSILRNAFWKIALLEKLRARRWKNE